MLEAEHGESREVRALSRRGLQEYRVDRTRRHLVDEKSALAQTLDHRLIEILTINPELVGQSAARLPGLKHIPLRPVSYHMR